MCCGALVRRLCCEKWHRQAGVTAPPAVAKRPVGLSAAVLPPFALQITRKCRFLPPRATSALRAVRGRPSQRACMPLRAPRAWPAPKTTAGTMTAL